MLFPNGVQVDFAYFFLNLIALLSAMCVAMPIHEFAHALAAKREGDYTAVVHKRLTLAPHAHFDLKGFIFLLLFRFGWAKPVPIDSRNFKRGRKSQFLVSSAGIIANLITGTFFLFVYMLILRFFPNIFGIKYYGSLLLAFLDASISFNFMLAFINLLPIYPLDGYKMIESCYRFENNFLRITRQYSLIIFLIFSLSGLYYYYYMYTGGLLMQLLVKLFSLILGL